MEWDDVDFENLLIRVSKTYNSRLNIVKSTRAGYWRNVPISSELRSIFIDLKLKLDSDLKEIVDLFFLEVGIGIKGFKPES